MIDSEEKINVIRFKKKYVSIKLKLLSFFFVFFAFSISFLGMFLFFTCFFFSSFSFVDFLSSHIHCIHAKMFSCQTLSVICNFMRAVYGPCYLLFHVILDILLIDLDLKIVFEIIKICY